MRIVDNIRKRIKAGFFRRKPRIETDKETQKLIKDIADGMIPTPTPHKKLKPSIFKRSGFKRITGTIITTAGTVLAFLPKYSHIGQAIMAIGATLGIGGSVHGAVKNKKSDDKTQIIKTVLLWIVEFIMKLFTKNKEKNDG